jgi:hypothetical protein
VAELGVTTYEHPSPDRRNYKTKIKIIEKRKIRMKFFELLMKMVIVLKVLILVYIMIVMIAIIIKTIIVVTISFEILIIIFTQ